MARKSQLNRGVFRCNISRTRVQQGQRGRYNFQPDDVAKLNIPIYLILLWLFVDIRTPRRRRSKIGEDGSATPLWKGFLSARVEGAILHVSTRPPEGCSRPL